MCVDTYVDDRFEGCGIEVTVPEGTKLSERQRLTILRVADRLSDEACFALIDDQTCVVLPSDDGRYGFRYFCWCVSDQMKTYEIEKDGYYPPDLHLEYVGEGEYLLVVSSGLIRLVLPDDYRETPAALRMMGISKADQLLQRDKAWDTCSACAEPLAMVVPREPKYHEEYDEEKASWDEGYDYHLHELPENRQTGAGTLMRVLHGEYVAVTRFELEEYLLDQADLQDELLDDLQDCDHACEAEIHDLIAGTGMHHRASDLTAESLDARIAAIKEEFEREKSLRQQALNVFAGLRVGHALKNDVLIKEILLLYSNYVDFETGPGAVRFLLESSGFDPEWEIEEWRAKLDALREDPAYGWGSRVIQRRLVTAQQMYGLLRELLEMEEAERRAPREVARPGGMQLREGNILRVVEGPFEREVGVVREVDSLGRYAVVELELMGRKVNMRIAEAELQQS